MIVEYIRYRLSDHTPEALVNAYQTASVQLDAAPECLGYELSQCVESVEVFVLRIEWTSAEDHMNGFRRGENFPPFLAAIRPFIGEIEEMRHYGVTSVASTN